MDTLNSNQTQDPSAVQQENQKLINDLDAKVSILKQVTIDIRNQMKSDADILDDLDSRFDSVFASISSATSKVKRIISNGGSQYMLYIVLFAFFMFFGLYILLR